MTDVLSRSIKNLRESSSRLNQITDNANESVRLVEDFLSKECQLGMSAYVPIKEKSNGITQYLEYRKITGKFRIAVVLTSYISESDTDVKPWSHCPRSVKLEAIKKLPALLDELNNKVIKQIDDTESATEDVLNAMESATGKGE